MSGEHGLVSVVIPSFNYGRFVTEAVESVLAQTYSPVEVIVIDDGSTDDTRQRLEPYIDRIRYIHQNNQGLSAARNAGIKAAHGEWIALLDADDLWHPQKTEIQLAAANSMAGVALIGSRATEVMPSVLPPTPQVRSLGVRDFLLSSRMGPSSAVIRRSSFESIGFFDETLKSVEDRDMWLRIAARFPCALVVSPCWWYRHHPGQMSRNAGRMYSNYSRVLQKFFAEHPAHVKLYRDAMAYLCYDAAWTHFAEGRRVAGLRYLLRSALYRPMGLGDEQIAEMFVRVKIGARMIAGPPVIRSS